MKAATRQRAGFTMVEMMVVLGVIILAAGIALPSITTLMQSGADKQAYNLVAAQIRAARALAIEEGTYAGVHIQLADDRKNPDMEGTCYAGVVIFQQMDSETNPTMAYFDVAGGYDVHPIPGNMAFGDLSNEKGTIGGGGDFSYGNPKSFTTMTLIFAPSGRLIYSVQGKPVRLSPTSPFVSGSNALWDDDRGSGQREEFGTSAICMFNYREFSLAGSSSNKSDYMNKNAILLPVNVHTGQLFPLE
ncbi:MAG: Tfp pilus assembly protein FimT/FimU [Phycisphaerae bacterium]